MRGDTIFGMHKFELVPMRQNGMDFLEDSFSSTHSSKEGGESSGPNSRRQRNNRAVQ